MRKCPFCGKENYKEKYFCETCGSYMGSEHVDGLPPIASEKIKAQAQKSSVSSPQKRVSKKRQKSPEYVKLYHGGIVKKSTYNWLKKKDEETGRFILVFLGVMLFLALIKECS
jgi:hypothetical protein